MNSWANKVGGSTAAAVSNDRTLFLYANLIGTSVLVETDKGVVWEGLFSAVSHGEVALQSARICVTPSVDANAPGFWVDSLKLPLSTVMSISAPGNASVPCGQVSAASSIKKVVPQVQTPTAPLDWAADSDDETLEQAEKKYVPGTFNQFDVNERKFGVQSTYKETDYTTDLNQRQYSNEERARADKLTRDINRSAVTSEAHRIERGLDSAVDEGTLYSDVKRSGINMPAPRGSKPSTPASANASGITLPSATAGSWAEQQRLKKAGKLPMGSPSTSSNPTTPTIPAPASASKKPSAFEGTPSVPVAATTSNTTTTTSAKPISSPLQATPSTTSPTTATASTPTTAVPAPKKSALSASAPAFNVAAAPWTPSGAARAAPPSILSDILSGGAIRFATREIDPSAFPWMDAPYAPRGGDYHLQYHSQPREHHQQGPPRGNNYNNEYNPHHHQQQHHVPQVLVAPHQQHHQHHQHQHSYQQQPHGSHHHHNSHQQHRGYEPRQPFNSGERGGSAPPQEMVGGPPPPSHHMPPQQLPQHPPASIGRGGGSAPAPEGGPVNSVMRGRGRGRASAGGFS